MRTAQSFCVLITAVAVNVSCRGVLGPSCTDESGGVLRTEGVVLMDGASTHTGCFAEVVQPADTTDVDRPPGDAGRQRHNYGLRRAYGVRHGNGHTATRSRWVLSGPPTMAGRRAGDAGGWLAREDLPHRHHRRPDSGCDVCVDGHVSDHLRELGVQRSHGCPGQCISCTMVAGASTTATVRLLSTRLKTCVNQRDPPGFAARPGIGFAASSSARRPVTRPIRIRNGTRGRCSCAASGTAPGSHHMG